MRSIVFFLFLAAALPAHAQERSPAPSPDCLDARRLQEIHQADARTFAVQDSDGRRFRLALASDCPLQADTPAVLLAREGWVCGTGNEFVRSGPSTCAVTALTGLDARTYASLARTASHADDGVTTLETVSVRAPPRRRGFAGSPSFCFNPRYLRAWSEDSAGMLVELSPRRSGGHRYYRVELAQNCPDLDSAPAIVFRSGLGIGVICGNPGDRIIAQDSGGGSLFDAGDSDLMFAEDPRLSRMGMRFQCTVSAVYPHEPQVESARAPR
jgi:hypothetical protein